jgi:protein-serine/threonine kinase
MSGDMEKVINHCKEHDYSYDEDFIAYVCYRVIHGINFLHEHKIVHRDIKSDNILYNYKGEIKIADLGAAVT